MNALATLALLVALLRPAAGDEAKLGREAYARKEYAEAAARFEKALAQPAAARDGELRLLLASCRLALDRFADAERLLREAIALGVDSADVHRELGFALARQDRLDEAIASYARAKQRDPAGPDGLSIARLLIARGRLELAAAELGEALRRDPAARATWELLARVDDEAGRVAEAVAAWRVVVELAPADGKALLALARAQAVAGDAGDAADTLEMARRIGALDLDGRRLLGDLDLRLGLAADAVRQYEAVVADPAAAKEDWLRLAQARQRCGDRAGALETLAGAGLPVPDHGPDPDPDATALAAAQRRVRTEVDAARWPEAFASARAALRDHPFDETLRELLATTLRQMDLGR